VGNCGGVSVRGDDIAPSRESVYALSSPMDVTVAVYESPVVKPVNVNVPVVMPVIGVVVFAVES
jgi:hypothetical protein